MKSKKYVFIVILKFIFLQQYSLAQSYTAPISIENLEQIWKISLANNSNVKIFALQEKQAIQDLKVSKGLQLPQIGLNFTGQNNLKLATTPVPGDLIGQPGKTVFLQFGKAYTYNAGLTISQSIFDWQLKLQNQLVQESSKLLASQKDAFIQNLKADIAKNYYSLLVAKASLEIATKDKQLADSILKLTSKRLDQGLTDASTVNLAQINLNNVFQNEIQSEILVRQASTNLHLLIGLPLETPLIIKESLDPESVKGKLLTISQPDKTLLTYRQSVLIAEMQKKVKQASFLPKLYANGFTGSQQFRDNFGMGFNNGAWKNYRYIGVNLNWPIFTGFSKKATENAAILDIQIAEEQYQKALTQSAINDANLLGDYTSNFKMVENSKSTFKLYAKNLDLARQKFEVGLITADMYCKQFEDYLHVENSYLSQLSNFLLIEAVVLSRK